MAAAKPPKPTPAELEILQVLWAGGPRTVREVQRVLNEKKPTGYTTALKMLQIMTEKNLVVRNDRQRPQTYRARYPREQMQSQLLHDLVQRVFGGSVKALVLQALAGRRSSPEELQEIERLLDRMGGQTK
jgi:predicted transcriptional regulator